MALVTTQLREGQLVAFTGDDAPDVPLFTGQPGVVIDVGPDGREPSVSFVGGPSIGLPESELIVLDPADYEVRAAAMKASTHPITGSPITPLAIASPRITPN